MHAAFARNTVITRRALICALFLVALVSNARLIIKDGVFGRSTVVVAKGGTLTLKNADDIAYRVKVGATLVIVPAKGSKTIPLPQRGMFSITCAKAPNLKATLTVK